MELGYIPRLHFILTKQIRWVATIESRNVEIQVTLDNLMCVHSCSTLQYQMQVIHIFMKNTVYEMAMMYKPGFFRGV